MALTLEYLFLWFLLYAFIGWVYESVLVSVSERRWVNRGFLNGPLCPIYGCGAVLAIVLLRDFTYTIAKPPKPNVSRPSAQIRPLRLRK